MKLSQSQISTIKEFFATKPIRKAYLFGSFARGEATKSSDIDIMVEFEEGTSMGLAFFGLSTDLMERLGKKVDITTVDGFSPYVVDRVMQERQLIFQKDGA